MKKFFLITAYLLFFQIFGYTQIILDESFEYQPIDWTIVNTGQTNQWHNGLAVAHEGKASLYISNDNGISNSYNVNATSVVHAYKNIYFPHGSQYVLSFWWKGQGEGATAFYDCMRLYLVDTTVTPLAGTILTDGQIGNSYNLQQNWTNTHVILPGNLSNKYKRLVITWKNDYSIGTQPPAAIDDITIRVITCPAPSSLVAGVFTQTSTQLNWTAGGTETQWNIQYGLSGFTLGTGTIVTAYNKPYILSGLSPSTTYSVYVQAVCSPGVDSSIWIGPSTFTTLCGIANVPYSQNFDLANVPNIPNCTSIENAGTGNNWVTANAPNQNFSGKILRYSFSSNPANAWFYTPGINLTGGQTYRLTFKYGNSSTNWTERLKVCYGSSANSASMTNLLLDFPNINQATAQNAVCDFTPTTTGVYYFGFNAYSLANQYMLYLDDILLTIAPSCPEPRDLSISNIGLDSAIVSWTPGGNETAWKVKYVPQGFPPNSGFIFNATTNTFKLTGLSPSTYYSVYVKAICTPNADESIWAGPIGFYTLCGAASIPYNQDFESAIVPAIPLCTSVENAGTGNNWTIANAPNQFFTSKTLTYKYHQTNPANAWFFTSGINLTGGQSYRLTFKYGKSYSMYTENLRVAYGPTATHIAMIDTILDFPNITDYIPQIATTDFIPLTTGIYYIGFNCYSVPDQFNLYVDDIHVELSPSCPAPRQLDATNITQTSATLSWINGSTETLWQIEWGPQGFTLGNGTSITVNSNPYVLNGLSVNTNYSFYVKAICTVGDESVWAGPFNFSTPQIPATIPFAEDFENTTLQWTIVNGLQTNKWFHGNAVAHAGTKSAYISNDNGVTNTYNNSVYSTVHIYRDIIFPAGNDINLSFWWRSLGEAQNFDFLKVFLVNTSIKPLAGTQLNSGAIAGNYYNQANWKKENIIIPALATSQTLRFVFSWHNDNSLGNQPPVAIDDIELSVITCPSPSQLTVTNATTNTATLNWTPGSNETAWQIEYGLADFLQGTGTIVNVTNRPFLLTGLTENTRYMYFVRAVCSVGNESAWAGPYYFSTTQIPATIPFTEDFETTHNNWTLVNDNQTNKWAHGTATYHSNNRSLYISSDNGINNTYNTNATSLVHAYRDILFPNASQFQLSFWWKGIGEQQLFDFMTVYLIDPATGPVAGIPINIGSIGGVYYNQSSWIKETITLPGSISNSVKRLVFSWKNDYTMGTQPPIAIDDINIIIINCPYPTNLEARNITTTSANLKWYGNGTETMWNIQYGPQGFTLGSGTIITTASNPYLLGGLNPNTAYSFYVRAICNVGIYSDWFGPYNFRTHCNYMNVPYSQNFENVVVPAIPACHFIENAGLGNNWETSNPPGNGFTTKVLRYNYHLSQPANAWFFTPGLNLTAGNTYKLSFKYGKSDAVEPERLKVAYGLEAASIAMTNILADFSNITQNTPQIAEINFTPTQTNTYFIGFNAYSDEFGWFLFVDDIVLDQFVGVDDKNNESFNLYPNPSNGIIYLNNVKNNIHRLVVESAEGKTILVLNNVKNLEKIDLSAYAKGVYFIHFYTENHIITKKILLIE